MLKLYMRIPSKYKKLAACVVMAIFVWMMPAPRGVESDAWKTFAIFLYVLIGMILKPISIGVITLSSLMILVLTDILSFGEAFAGFSNPTIWLIVFAFFIARGFIKTGLGLRIAYNLMIVIGKNTLGIAYGIVFTDFILASSIPSVAARSGGIIYPIIVALSKAFDSTPENNPRKIGSYLIKTIFQCSAVTSAMFLTAMAGNPIVQSLAKNSSVNITWSLWALAAIVPGLSSLILIPYIIYKIYPPEIKHTPEAKKFAISKLKEMGKISTKELIMIFTFVLMILLWILAPYVKIDATITALLGLCILLFTNVLSFDDVLKESGAWDTLIWFAALITIAFTMNKFGLMAWFSGHIETHVKGMSWQLGFTIIGILYYYLHYFFASNIAHITSLYAPFLILSIAIGTPPTLAALTLGFFSSLFGSLTPYGSGPAPIYFGSGYILPKDWWRIGFIISLVNIIIWVGIGGLWWYIIGIL